MEKFNDELGDLSPFKILNFEKIRQDFSGNKDFFEDVRRNKIFQEISNEIALSSPFGNRSKFYKELREILTGQIPKL